MAYPHVLVHHALPCFLRQQVPVRRLRERVDDEVTGSLTGEQRLLLLGGPADVLRRTDPADERLADRQPAPEPGTEEGRGRGLQDVDARRHAPEQEIDTGLEADRRIAECPDPIASPWPWAAANSHPSSCRSASVRRRQAGSSPRPRA